MVRRQASGQNLRPPRPPSQFSSSSPPFVSHILYTVHSYLLLNIKSSVSNPTPCSGFISAVLQVSRKVQDLSDTPATSGTFLTSFLPFAFPLDSNNMPDLNSVPPSPHILAASRRTSSIQNPPASHHPTRSSIDSSSSINILPSNQQTVNQGLSGTSLPSPSAAPIPGMAQPQTQGQDNTGVGTGPGPLRHPRPLTAAELHSQLEQEQELLVCLIPS